MKSLSAVFLVVVVLSIICHAQDATKTTDEAGRLIRNGDTAGAIAVLDKAIERRKDLFEAYRMRAPLRFFNGNIQGAVTDLDRALEIKVEPSLYVQRAEFKGFLRDLSGALQDYDSAIANGHRTEKAYNGRAHVKRMSGDFKAAIADYRIAVGLAPDSAGANVGLASTLHQDGDIDAAMAVLQGFLDRYEETRSGKLPTTKGEVVAKSDLRRPESNDGVEQVILTGRSGKQMNKEEETMNAALAYANLAQIQESKSDIDTAMLNVEKSISINKADGFPVGLRGKIKLGKGELADAIVDLSTAIRSMPQIPTHYADRGIAFLLQGNDAQAQTDFDKFLQLFPKGSEALTKRIAEAKEKRLQNSPH